MGARKTEDDANTLQAYQDKYGLIRYESLQNVPPWWMRVLHEHFGLFGWVRYYAEGPTFEDLALHVTIQGTEPGHRAERAIARDGRKLDGLDFYSLDPRNTPGNKWTWCPGKRKD